MNLGASAVLLRLTDCIVLKSQILSFLGSHTFLWCLGYWTQTMCLQHHLFLFLRVLAVLSSWWTVWLHLEQFLCHSFLLSLYILACRKGHYNPNFQTMCLGLSLKYLFIYLTVPGLSCGMQDLFLLWLVESSFLMRDWTWILSTVGVKS